MAAADGFRLARKVVQLGTPVEHTIKLIIPSRSMVELARALPDDEGEEAEPVSIVVTPNRNQVLFRHDNLEVTSRLVDGNYVDINRVIPADWGTRTVMLSRLCRRALAPVREVIGTLQVIRARLTLRGDDLGQRRRGWRQRKPLLHGGGEGGQIGSRSTSWMC